MTDLEKSKPGEKLIQDGLVAVLYSPGFGAGWSTWGRGDASAMVFDRTLALAVLSGDRDLIEKVAQEVFPEEYQGGVDQLSVSWVEQGTQFLIEEYDGSESIIELGPQTGYIA